MFFMETVKPVEEAGFSRTPLKISSGYLKWKCASEKTRRQSPRMQPKEILMVDVVLEA